MSEESEDILAHYGVQGMQWGRRKEDRAQRQAGGGRITPLLSVKGKPVLSVVQRTSPLAQAKKNINNANNGEGLSTKQKVGLAAVGGVAAIGASVFLSKYLGNKPIKMSTLKNFTTFEPAARTIIRNSSSKTVSSIPKVFDTSKLSSTQMSSLKSVLATKNSANVSSWLKSYYDIPARIL